MDAKDRSGLEPDQGGQIALARLLVDLRRLTIVLAFLPGLAGGASYLLLTGDSTQTLVLRSVVTGFILGCTLMLMILTLISRRHRVLR